MRLARRCKRSAELAHCAIVRKMWVTRVKLQERRDRQTRKEIYEAAMSLFAKRGLTQTTVAQIADTAGVSRRTIYRHFPAKEEIAGELPRQWLERFNKVVGTQQPSETSKQICRRGVLEVARLIESDRDRVMTAYRVLSTMTDLARQHASSNRQWLETYCALLGQDDAPGDTSAALRTAAVAGVLMSGTDAALLMWIHDPKIDLEAMTGHVWELATRL